MPKLFFKIATLLCFAVVSVPKLKASVPVDSMGLKVKDGKVYVMHKVDPGETVTKLSRRYQCSIAAILDANQLPDDGIRLGQVLLIPAKNVKPGGSLNPNSSVAAPKVVPAKKPVVKPPLVGGKPVVAAQKPTAAPVQKQATPATPKPKMVQSDPSAKYHTVEPKQTLFSLSKMYGVSVNAIKSVNQLASDDIRIGQKLKIPTTAENEIIKLAPVASPVVAPSIKDPIAKTGGKEPEMYEGRKIGHYLVEEGETLFSIAYRLKLDVETLKKLNHLPDDKIIPGMWLKIFGVPTEAPNVVEGSPKPVEIVSKPIVKINENPVPVQTASQPATPTAAIAPAASSSEDRSDEHFVSGKYEPVEEVNSPPKPLGEINHPQLGSPSAGIETAATEKPKPLSSIPPGAEAKEWIEPGTNKPTWLVKETGLAGKMDGDAKQQKKFYATHAFLPKGTIVKVDNPSKKQSVTVEIIGRGLIEDEALIRLSDKARAYLMLEDDGSKENVELRYSLPREN